MTITQPHGSATIHPFPPRAATSLRTHREVSGSVVDLRATHRVPLAVGSGWYHETAIADAALVGKV